MLGNELGPGDRLWNDCHRVLCCTTCIGPVVAKPILAIAIKEPYRPRVEFVVWSFGCSMDNLGARVESIEVLGRSYLS